MTNPNYGWRHDKEDRAFLRNRSIPFKLFGTSDLPDKVDPRGFISVKNQGQVGACAGFSRASCMEVLSSGGIMQKNARKFSEMHAYLSAQKIDGLLGRDVGSTISGQIRASEQYGNAPQELFPFPGKYVSQWPSECDEPAKQHRLLKHSKITTVESLRQHIGSFYPVTLGIMWDNSLNTARLQNYNPNPRSAGGHAICLLGYIDEWYWMLNSWSEQWGDRGWAMWHERAVARMLQHQHSEFVAVTDMTRPEPRRWNYRKDLVLG